MKFGLLSYGNRKTGRFNVGDHIQSLAAKQYLPKVDDYIERDKLNSAKLEEKTSIIMNGWFTHNPENWPPAPEINPLFISFHLNSHHAEALLSNSENIKYLKKYEPIGCRDENTVKWLNKFNITAYYSSCLTTTLDIDYKTDKKSGNILMVDVLYKNDYKKIYKDNPLRIIPHILKGKFFKRNDRENTIKDLIPADILRNAEYETHSYYTKDYTEEQRFKLADDLLKKYACAKLVITSRIHCALPCLAMGTPVVFVAGGDLFNEHEISRLKGTIEHLNIISADDVQLTSKLTKMINIRSKDSFDWHKVENGTSHLKYAEELKKICKDFIAKNK